MTHLESLIMSTVKKQHFVPQFYLRSFTHDGDSLYAFDKPSLRSFKTSILGVGQERYFYNTNSQDIEALKKELQQDPDAFLEALKEIILQTKDKWYIQQFMKEIEEPDIHEKLIEIATDPQYLETKILAPHDARSAQLLKQVIREIRVRKRIKANHRKDLAFLMAVQVFRTPKYRYEMIDVQEKLLNQLVQEEVFPDEENDVRITYDRDFQDRITSSALLDPDFVSTIAGILNSHIWQIGINSTSQPLYTSDAPIVKYGHLSHLIAGVGFASPGVEIAYPLSPEYILIMYERTFFQDRVVLDGRSFTLTEDNVLYYNSLQVQHSRRQLYCSEDMFALATEMCEKYPKLRDPNRSTVQVE